MRLNFDYLKRYKKIELTGNYLMDHYIIYKQNFDIVHYNPLTIFSPIFVKGLRVTTIHGASGVALPKELGLIRYVHDKYIRSFLVKFMDHIFTVSESSFFWLVKEYGINKSLMTLTHNGLSTEMLNFYQKKNKRNKFSERSLILHVSNFSKRKNPYMVLKVFKGIANLNKDVDLVIAGNGWNNPKIQSYIRHHNLNERISIKGFINDSDLFDLYSKAKVYFSPSLYEGFGMPNIEAMFFGVPVVISKAFAAGSIVGDAGHVCESPNDFLFFLESIIKLSTDENYWNKYSNLSIQRSLDFNWVRTASKTIETYNSIYKKTV